MSEYTVIIEEADGNLSGYVPDLPVCGSVGATEEELIANIQEAIELHLQSLREHGEPTPVHSTRVRSIQVA